MRHLRHPAWLTLIALAALATLAAPASPTAATSATLTFSETFGTATLEAEGDLDGADAQQMRSFFDRSGDGNVTAQEAQQFLDAFRSTIGQQVGTILTRGNFTLDGEGIVGSEMGRIDLQGAAGPVRGGPPIAFELDMTLLFHPAEGDSHVLRLEGRPMPGGPLRLTVQAPAGWEVGTIQVDASVLDPEPGFASSRAFDVPDQSRVAVMLSSQAEGTPGPALWSVAAAVALALACRRKGAR